MSAEKTEIEQLYTSNYQRLLTIARLMLKDEKEAEDIVGDLFARLADGSITLPSERPESYLLVATRNNCVDRIRRLTLREKMERQLSLSDPNPLYMESGLERITEMIDYAEKNFPKPTWRVFQLRFDEGLLYREIAERLGISETTVYKHLANALKQLKKTFNPTRR
jgi:RNA polymerase sigma-70 factor (ECF subfamily)